MLEDLLVYYKRCSTVGALDDIEANGSTPVQSYDPGTFFCFGDQSSLLPAAAVLIPCLLFGAIYILNRAKCYTCLQRLYLQWFITTTTSSSDSKSTLPHSMKVPRHIAVIMDGNRRYGRQQFGDASRGHAEGAQRLTEFVEWCMDAGVEILTVYAFSTENWKRSKEEVDYLMTLFQNHMEQIRKESIDRNVRLRVMASDPSLLPDHILETINRMESDTIDNTSFTLNMCVSYGGRSEILGACRSIAADVASGAVPESAITEQLFSDRLLSSGLPDPDLLIRTSGEQRLSNFLLWQLAYTEMIFLAKPWPSITREDLNQCIVKYNIRNRRFGK